MKFLRGLLLFILSVLVLSCFLWRREAANLNRSKYWVTQFLDLEFESTLSYQSGRNFCSPLSKEEQVLYNKCLSTVQRHKKRKTFGPIEEGHCCFMNGTGRKVVGLGSFPGSGNTWLRGLLEKATGICTGAPYCDIGLRTKGFNGEGVVGPSVVVVKSHSVRPKFTSTIRNGHRREQYFNAGILLIRNPRKAFIADWHRRKTKRLANFTVNGHFLSAGKQYFGTNSDWNKFVIDCCERWKQHVCGWAISGKNYPVHIVAYEDLQSSTTNEIISIMKFFRQINNPLPFKLAKLEAGFEKFHRKQSVVDFDHFTNEQETLIQETIARTISVLRELYQSDSKLIQCLQSYYYNQ